MATYDMQKLREYRIARGLSQSDLAASVGVKKATISRIEKGLRVPSMGLVARIVRISAGELSADDFMPRVKSLTRR
jgi:DNA-binding XRE family transcriptional regulator